MNRLQPSRQLSATLRKFRNFAVWLAKSGRTFGRRGLAPISYCACQARPPSSMTSATATFRFGTRLARRPMYQSMRISSSKYFLPVSSSIFLFLDGWGVRISSCGTQEPSRIRPMPAPASTRWPLLATVSAAERTDFGPVPTDRRGRRHSPSITSARRCRRATAHLFRSTPNPAQRPHPYRLEPFNACPRPRSNARSSSD